MARVSRKLAVENVEILKGIGVAWSHGIRVFTVFTLHEKNNMFVDDPFLIFAAVILRARPWCGGTSCCSGYMLVFRATPTASISRDHFRCGHGEEQQDCGTKKDDDAPPSIDGLCSKVQTQKASFQLAAWVSPPSDCFTIHWIRTCQ